MAETILGNPETGVVENNVIDAAPAPIESTPATPAPYDYSKMMSGEGVFAENWREALPEAIRGEKSLDSIKTIGALAQSYVHAQKAIGVGKVAIPGEHATPEEWAAFWTAGGRPETADGYSIDGIQLPEGVTLDEAAIKDFRELAFASGISQKGFEAALAYDIKRAQAAADAAEQKAQQEYEETTARLRQEYGSRADEVVAQCNATIYKYGLREVLQENNLLSNFTMIKALADIGAAMSETRIRGVADKTAGTDIQSRLNELQGNLDSPFYRRDHPGHAAAVEEVGRLLAAMARANKN